MADQVKNNEKSVEPKKVENPPKKAPKKKVKAVKLY